MMSISSAVLLTLYSQMAGHRPCPFGTWARTST